MKKILAILLTLVFVLSFAGAALANPAEQFVDVPPKHWAYDAVAKLAQAGIVDGDNGRYLGDKSITRYEMALIVAKAIAKEDKADAENKALIDKLAKEFTSELATLGVRFNKLEKQVGNLGFGADVRLAWLNYTQANKHDPVRMRFRLSAKADVSENTSFFSRIVFDNQAEAGTFYSTDSSTYTGLDRVHASEFNFTSKNFAPGMQLTYGRFAQQMDVMGYWMLTGGGVDGAKISMGNKLKVEAGYADFAPAYAQFSGNYVQNVLNYDSTGTRGNGLNGAEIKQAVWVKTAYPVNSALTLGAWAFRETSGSDAHYNMRAINFSAKLSPKWNVAGDYGKNMIRNSYVSAQSYKPNFYHYRLTYGPGEKWNVPGSWSLAGEYYRFEPGVSTVNYTANMVNVASDIKGFAVIAKSTVEKNIIGSVAYAFKNYKISNESRYPNYFRVELDYLF
jgi:hypothetical protein